jgi:hypothetical protein
MWQSLIVRVKKHLIKSLAGKSEKNLIEYYMVTRCCFKEDL